MSKAGDLQVETSTNSAFRIREVTSSDREGIDRITELHMELLSFGPMAKFGDEVIRETIYVVGLSDDLMKVAIAEINGEPAGFIAYTMHADDFHQTLIKNHFFKAALVMLKSLIMQPSRIRHLPRAFQVVTSRNELPSNIEGIQSEVLCIGVRPQYLTPAFVRQTNLRIGARLLEHAFEDLRRNGFTKTLMIVDADNPRALLFYQSLGAELTACTFGGVPSYFVQFDL